MKLMKLNLDNKNTSEYVVSKLFKSWKDKDFKKANKYIQGTWLYHNNEKEFEKIFGIYKLIDFYFYDKEIITNCRHEIDFRVDVILEDKTKSLYGKANMICETAPYEPSPKGKWGVNPISLLRWHK